MDNKNFMRPKESKEFEAFRKEIIVKLGLTWEDWCWLWDKIGKKCQLFEPKSEWCPQHGYPLPCYKCGMPKLKDRTNLREFGSPKGLPRGWRGRVLKSSEPKPSGRLLTFQDKYFCGWKIALRNYAKKKIFDGIAKAQRDLTASEKDAEWEKNIFAQSSERAAITLMEEWEKLVRAECQARIEALIEEIEAMPVIERFADEKSGAVESEGYYIDKPFVEALKATKKGGE